MCHSLVILLVVILTSSVVSACFNETAVVKKTVITPVNSSIDEIGIRLLSTDVSVGMNRLAFGLIEKGKRNTGNNLGYPIIGTDEELVDIRNHYDNAIITVGQIKSSDIRVKLYNILNKLSLLKQKN